MYLCVCMRVEAAFGDWRVEVERVGGVGVGPVLSICWCLREGESCPRNVFPWDVSSTL